MILTRVFRNCLLTSVLALAVVSSNATAQDGNGRTALQHFYTDVQTFVAHFEQVQLSRQGRVLQKASGTFYLARPNRFRWVYKEPYKQIIVSNGEVFKFYDVGLKQVTVRSADASLRGTPASLLAGRAALEDAFRIEDRPTEDRPTKGGINWLVLKPRADNAQFRKIKLGLKNNLPKVMRLYDKLGQTTVIKFSDIRINPDIPAGRFNLDVPDDVNVVDTRRRQSARQQGANSSGAGW